MPFRLDKRRSSRRARRKINIHQNRFNKGYISTLANSRRPTNSFSDLTNMELVQDAIPRPRPPLVAYGTQPDLTVIGRGQIRYGGDRYIIWMMNAVYYDTGTAAQSGTAITGAGTTFTSAMVGMDIVWGSGETAVITAYTDTTHITVDTSQTVSDGAYEIYTGKLYKQKDGGAFTLLGGTYDSSAWASLVQNRNRAYVYNGVDNLSYIDLTDDSIKTYTELSTPANPTVSYTGTAGTYTHYYRISANNEVGESIGSAVASATTAKLRDEWVVNTDYCDIGWDVVTGATSYTIYYGVESGTQEELYTVTGDNSFRDLGTLAPNVYRTPRDSNSTKGAIFNWMYTDTQKGQVYGITADSELFYSAPGTGDFSPLYGGGSLGIDRDGDSELNYVTGFRTGKGDPIITVSARGAAGKGKLYHVTFSSVTIVDQTLYYPEVFEANGQSGTYAPRATIKNKDSLVYPTGEDFKSTGTSQNIVNILTTNSVSTGIMPDVDRLSLESLHKAVGLAYQDKLYFALPVGTSENNEIWYMDSARKNLWVLRWPIAAKDMWLYEDNDGYTHFCVLVGSRILEFTRAGTQTHQDDGTAWRSRAAFSSLVWDEDGIILGKIRNQYFKFLDPKGSITVNATALTRKGASSSVGSDDYTTDTTATGIGRWLYGGALLQKNAAWEYGDAPGEVKSYGKSIAILKIRPKGLVAQLDWEVVASTTGTDYTLSAVNTKGTALEDLVLKTE